METSQIPDADDDITVPERVVALADGEPIRPVWLNEVGGITFQLGEPGSAAPDRRFVKWAPHGRGLKLAAEEARLRWAIDYATVPRVLSSGSDHDADWLETSGVPGRSAVDAAWRARPAVAVDAIARGLRHLHDTLPVDACPFDRSVASRIAEAVADGKPAPALPAEPSIERLVVCHGDPCSPNTLIGDDGSWSGHVDFDVLGVGDRWADIAVATMALEWNYGPGWDDAFLDAYGIEPDPVRTEFYRALWNFT